MTSAEIINFNRDVVNYINDNLEYMGLAVTMTAKEKAEHAWEHYEWPDEEDYTEDKKKVFLLCAERLFTQGYVEHAGHLVTGHHDEYINLIG